MHGENEVEKALWCMRDEFNHTLNALLFIHPQNTRTDDKFEEAYRIVYEALGDMFDGQSLRGHDKLR